ncbi:MAG: hypothetical protein ACP5QO_04630 [Clostridia bacterium]
MALAHVGMSLLFTFVPLVIAVGILAFVTGWAFRLGYRGRR